ncbi:MAG: MBL fold metallo-hydrolase [Spirochaetes bacterium]|nr:MBL fold metallo-hydrolase [Spirochaetota bacterium]
MKIKFHGVRGSYPKPGPSTVRYGGNTTCVSISKIVDNKVQRIIIDSGTGSINLGTEIVKNYIEGKEDLDISMLFTHLHPDHTQGFSFFAPNYFKECSMKLMGMRTLKKHIGMILEESMLPPTFPIEYKDLKSQRKHYELKDGITFKAKYMEIEVMQAFAPSHPQQGALYYKITDPDTNRSVACIWDLESKIGGDKAVEKFSTGCNVMIHDTQYTADEYNSDKMIVQGFGHSTYPMAVENANLAKVKDKLICTHFNPAHSDEKLDSIAEELKSQETGYEILLAQEGMEIKV